MQASDQVKTPAWVVVGFPDMCVHLGRNNSRLTECANHKLNIKVDDDTNQPEFWV